MDRRQVCFPYLGEIHQLPHSLPIAVQMALRHPDLDVTIAAFSPAHLEFARSYAQGFPDAALRYRLLAMPELPSAALRLVGQKFCRLAFNRKFFNSFDALVVPERTSLRLRRLGVTRPKFVWTGHGAGDRASGATRDIGEFDFVLLAGGKLEKRLLESGTIRPGRYVAGVYAKFDYVRDVAAARGPLFDNRRPTVLYNPHFWPELSSWPLVGRAVLDALAAQTTYNCVFAPHRRMFERDGDRASADFAAYAGLPHMLVDLGSVASIDMTYTLGADLYVGDVSSQVAEFLTAPRPCVFLNPRGVAWREDPNFRFWSLGEVVVDPDRLIPALHAARARQAERVGLQKAYIQDTFATPNGPTAHLGADAIARFMANTARATERRLNGWRSRPSQVGLPRMVR